MATFKQNVITAFKLFLIFFKIGLFSFGGGYAMLTMIEREIVDKRGYLTHEELMDIFAIAESTPGAIAINIATFIGTKQAGVFGGILTTLGVVLPSFIIIAVVSYVIDLVKDNVWVGYLFKGVRVGVLVLIARAVATFFRDMRKNWYDFVLLLASFSVAFFTDVNVIFIILGTILICIAGAAFKRIRMKKLGISADTAYQRIDAEEYEKYKRIKNENKTQTDDAMSESTLPTENESSANDTLSGDTAQPNSANGELPKGTPSDNADSAPSDGSEEEEDNK